MIFDRKAILFFFIILRLPLLQAGLKIFIVTIAAIFFEQVTGLDMRKVNSIIFIIFLLTQAIGIYFILDISETFFILLEYLHWIQGAVFVIFLTSIYLVIAYFRSTKKYDSELQSSREEIVSLKDSLIDMDKKLKE